MNVGYHSLDRGTAGQRLAEGTLVARGAAYFSHLALRCRSCEPAAIRCCERQWRSRLVGLAQRGQVQEKIDDWYVAVDQAGAQRVIADLSKAAADHIVDIRPAFSGNISHGHGTHRARLEQRCRHPRM